MHGGVNSSSSPSLPSSSLPSSSLPSSVPAPAPNRRTVRRVAFKSPVFHSAQPYSETNNGEDVGEDVGEDIGEAMTPIEPISKEEASLPAVSHAPAPATATTSNIRNIDGMSIANPNPFTHRMQKRMSDLFIVPSATEKFEAYTRLCPMSATSRRQPVVLTKEEKDELLREHKDDIDEEADILEYRSNPNEEPYYFTCPRFWCLLTDKMVTEKDILEGKCGPKVDKVEDAIIPRSAKTVPPGKYVFEFEPKKHYPGFHNKKMPNGHCIPCCYTNWKTPSMLSRRNVCRAPASEPAAAAPPAYGQVSRGEENANAEVGVDVQGHVAAPAQATAPAAPIHSRRTSAESENYVKAPDKYGPNLGNGRWGFLPPVIQFMFNEINASCQVSRSQAILKPNHFCLLRLGVEVSYRQSFIACIANALFYGEKDPTTKKPKLAQFLPHATQPVPTVFEMRKLMVQALSIDRFVQCQNGDLIATFADPNRVITLEDYASSELYKRVQRVSKKTEESKRAHQYLKKVVQAYEQFVAYLNDDSVLIDHTYLWDFVCMPNPRLFPEGINLILIEIPSQDTTNNVQLVCPTNHYSSHFYDPSRRSLVLLKREQFYEPIYGYFNAGAGQVVVTKTFSESDANLSPTMRSVFEKLIRPVLEEKCRPFQSATAAATYHFLRAKNCDDVAVLLEHFGYTLKEAVVNYQNKVIGWNCKSSSGETGFIPCFASVPRSERTRDLPQVFSDDVEWDTYDATYSFLMSYFQKVATERMRHVARETARATVADAPVMFEDGFVKVVEQEVVVGFMTQYNLFVPVDPPIPVSSVRDALPQMRNDNLMVADNRTLSATERNVDSDRVQFVLKIQLETQYYNAFRNTVRMLLNDYTNMEQRNQLQAVCYSPAMSYLTKLDKVKALLDELAGTAVVFAEMKMDGVTPEKVRSCVQLKEEAKCETVATENVCVWDAASGCSLVVPKHNLVTGADNEDIYFERMADELIRYNRVRSFLFIPQNYMLFGNVKYNVRKDEIIVLEDMLTREFFEGLVPAELNKYAQQMTYGTAEPYQQEIGSDRVHEVEYENYIEPDAKQRLHGMKTLR